MNLRIPIFKKIFDQLLQFKKSFYTFAGTTLCLSALKKFHLKRITFPNTRDLLN